MLKYLKVFLIYDLIIGILCSLGIECVNRGGLINSYFLVGLTFIIFMYIFLIPAPIVFAIKYGQRVARDQSFSFFSKLMLGFVMFIYKLYNVFSVPHKGSTISRLEWLFSRNHTRLFS